MKNLLLLFFFMICTGLSSVAFAQPGPTCTDLNIPVEQDDSATIVVGNFVPNAALAAPLTVSLKNPYGGVIASVVGADETTTIRFAACQYLGRELSLNVSNAAGPCWSKITLKQGNAPVIMGRKTTVYCNDTLVDHGNIGGVPPAAMIPCLPDGSVGTFVADWPDVRDCVLGEDTAKIIYREYEAFGKDGIRGTGFDTICVLRFPAITLDNTQCVERDTTYCGELLGENFGPFMLVSNPVTMDCDTVYFLNPDGTAGSFDAKCGLAVGVEVDPFDNECGSVTKYTVLLKQTCYGAMSTLCLVAPPGNLNQLGDGYWECVFWHIDLDTFPPVVTCSADTVIVPTSSHDCAAHTTLPPVTVTDSCHDIVLVKAMIEGLGTFPMQLQGDQWVSTTSVKIPHYEGAVKVVYEAFDACHNVGRDSCYIKVKDLTKPVAVCDKGVNVSLTGKKVWVNAESFDEGSWDNCGINMLLVRRSDWAEACVKLCDSVVFVDEGFHSDTLWSPVLSTDKHTDPVEAHYQKTIDWLNADGQNCANVLVQAWRYGLMHYATTVCKGGEESTFDDLALGVLDTATFDDAKQIGGGWSDQVVFTCEDACGPVQVEILVMDYWCNWSKCWSDVWVEDKTPVTIAKDVLDVDITCATYRDARYTVGGDLVSLEDIVAAADAGEADAYNALDTIFGTYRKAWRDPSGNFVDTAGKVLVCEIPFLDDSCFCDSFPGKKRVNDEHLGLIWKDTIGYECVKLPVAKTFGHGVVAVNCAQNVQCDQSIWYSFDNCGQGVIYRKFKIWQGCPVSTSGHIPDTLTRVQKIWVGNQCELEIGMFSLPQDSTVVSCDIQYDPDGSGNVAGAAHPDSVGRPAYNFDDDCRLVGIGYYDKVFRVVGGDEACYKIVRTWCFSDWCQVDKPITDDWTTNPSYEGIVLKYVQKIILIDTVAPSITISPLLGGDEVSAGGCLYDFATMVQVGDLCGTLSYRWALLDGTGAMVDDGAGTLSGMAGFDVAVAGLGTGSYTLRAVVVDGCQNEGIATYDFVVTTEKKPAVICITSLTAELTPMDTDNDGVIDTGMAVIWAAEYQNGSSAPACDDDSMAYYIEFIDSINDTTLDPEDADSLAIGCEHLADGPFFVRMWVKSFPSGTADYCDVMVVPQDNMNGCGDVSTTTGLVRGLIETELKESVEQVKVKANLSNGSSLDFLTTGSGAYNFATALGLDVTIQPLKNTDHMNGISTADLVRIQKHILGKALLETQYREMAADVNNDQRISALDLLDLRKLILGKVDQLPNSESWRFINMVDGQPSYDISAINQSMQVDFIGLKIGDVNLTNDPSQGAGRNNRSLVLRADDVKMQAGNSYQVQVKAGDFRNIEGYQFTLSYDASKVQLQDLNHDGGLDLTDLNFGMNRMAEGVITTSWSNAEPVDLETDDVLFTLTFDALVESTLSDVVTINSKVTEAEAYDASNDLLGVSLDFGQGIQQSGFVLHQNRPNPFRDVTRIGFDLPESMPATLTVYDVTGKVVKIVSGDYSKGYNEVSVRQADLNFTGVLYYQLDSESFTATRKMIVID